VDLWESRREMGSLAVAREDSLVAGHEDTQQVACHVARVLDVLDRRQGALPPEYCLVAPLVFEVCLLPAVQAPGRGSCAVEAWWRRRVRRAPAQDMQDRDMRPGVQPLVPQPLLWPQLAKRSGDVGADDACGGDGHGCGRRWRPSPCPSLSRLGDVHPGASAACDRAT